MKGRKENTDDRKRQGHHKRPNTRMARQAQDKTKVSAQYNFFKSIVRLLFSGFLNFIMVVFNMWIYSILFKFLIWVISDLNAFEKFKGNVQNCPFWILVTSSRLQATDEAKLHTFNV